jgi:hypothetical protein
MSKQLKNSLVSSGLLLIINYGWQGLELLFKEGISPSMSDTVVGLILLVSLYANYILISNNRANKKKAEMEVVYEPKIPFKYKF